MENEVPFLGMALSTWSIIANIAVVLVTAFMAVGTWRMASVTKKAFDAQNKPYVIVYSQQREDSPQILQIAIENVGASPAYDIKFTISENLYTKAWGIEKLAGKAKKITSGLFLEGIAQLVPKQKIVFDWGQFGGIAETLQGESAKVTVTFKDFLMRPQAPVKNILDVRAYDDSVANEPVSVCQAKSIIKIQEDLNNFIKLFSKTMQQP